MASVRQAESKVLERGDLFFFYRPDVDQEAPGGLTDVRRFHMVLRPDGGKSSRVITIGRKTLPEAPDSGGGPDQTHWAFVQNVFKDAKSLTAALGGADYDTQAQGERHLPPARPVGEGVYAIVRVGRDTRLAYALELPKEPGEVQRAFHITAQGRFVVSIKNPEAPSPAGLGLEEGRQAELPGELLARFGSRKWLPADPIDFLNYEGVELVLIAGKDRAGTAEELGLDLEPEAEDEESAEVFKVLKLERNDLNTKPLFEGTWE